MTKRFVKFVSLFAVVAMFLGLMVTGCSEGDNRSDSSIVAKLPVQVEQATEKGVDKDVDNIELKFYSYSGTCVKDVWFKDPDATKSGAKDWSKSNNTITMNVEFTKDEYEENCVLHAFAYDGSTFKGVTTEEITIATGSNDAVKLEGDFELSTSVEVKVAAYDKSASACVPEDTDNMTVTLSSADGQKTVERSFVKEQAAGGTSTVWHEDEDGIIHMYMVLNDTEYGYGLTDVEVVALKGKTELGKTVGTCSITKQYGQNEVDLTKNVFAAISTLDINVAWTTKCPNTVDNMAVLLIKRTGTGTETKDELLDQAVYCSEESVLAPYAEIWTEGTDSITMSGIDTTYVQGEVTDILVVAGEYNTTAERNYLIGAWHVEKDIKAGANTISLGEGTGKEGNFIPVADMESSLKYVEDEEQVEKITIAKGETVEATWDLVVKIADGGQPFTHTQTLIYGVGMEVEEGSESYVEVSTENSTIKGLSVTEEGSPATVNAKLEIASGVNAEGIVNVTVEE